MKRFFAILCALCLLLGLCACGNKVDEGKSTDGGEFTVAVCAAPDSLNPFVAQGELARELFRLVYDPLWRFDENYRPEPCLVESCDTSSDGLTWTIRLRQDVTFSDGEPLTSADVKFSWELFRQYGKNSARLFDGIESIKCPDDWTVVITTSYVKGDMMYGEVPILPEHIWSEYASGPYSMDNSAMIGSGPFVYHAPELGPGEEQQQWTLTSRREHFAAAAAIESLVFRLYDSPANAADALADGLVDAAVDLTDAQLFMLSGSYGVESFSMQGPGRGWCELVMNMSSGALADSVVREALLYAIDREEIFRMGFGSLGVYGEGFIEPRSPFYLNASLHRNFDRSQSAALLAASLYQDYDGDGVLESRDNTMELTLRLFSADDAWATATATILSHDLEEIGITIEWTTFSESDLRSRCTLDGDWDLYLIRRAGSLDPLDEAVLYANGASVSGWQSEQYDALYAQLVTCADADQKAELCRSLQSTLIDSYPGAILGYGGTVQAIRADRWAGYASLTSSLGGPFGTGCIKAYLSLVPAGEEVSTEETTTSAETETEKTLPAVTDANEPAPLATAVPLAEG